MSKLVSVKSGTGDHFEIAGARWTWKARGADTGGGFCFFEQIIKPGEGVPLHVHSYAEAFYLLEGELQFCSDDNAIISCSRGDVILAHPEVHHTFKNVSGEDARILSISTGAHQHFFDAVAEADQESPFAAMTLPDAFARVAAIGAKTDTRFTPSEPIETIT